MNNIRDDKKVRVNKNKVNEMWEKLKNKNKLNEQSIVKDIFLPKKEKIEIHHESNSLEIDLQIQAAINKVKEIKNNTIKETVYYAGKKYEYNKINQI